MRRCLSAVMATVLLMALAALFTGVASPRKIRSLHPQFADELAYAELDGQPVSTGELSDLQVFSDSILRIYLRGNGGSSLFLDQDGEAMHTADVTMSRLRAAEVEVSVSVAEDQAISVVAGLSYGNGGTVLSGASPFIELRFDVGSFIAEDQPFDLECTLFLLGKPQEQARLRIAGIICVQEQYVYADDGPLALKGGQVVCAGEDIPSIALLLNEEITLYTAMESGQRSFATARLLQRTSDAPVDGIIKAYGLDTFNLDKSLTRVKIRSEQALYVYDGAGDYLGVTADQLPYSDIYYLSSKQRT